jgi:hypothetical protein
MAILSATASNSLSEMFLKSHWTTAYTTERLPLVNKHNFSVIECNLYAESHRLSGTSAVRRGWSGGFLHNPVGATDVPQNA